MSYVQSAQIRYFTFDSFTSYAVPHAIFTRQGGVSQPPWDTLNVGGTVGDHPSAVATNRQLAFTALGLDLNSVYDVWQIHSGTVVIAQQPRQVGEPYVKADAILTDRPGVTLFMRFADCVPIFLYDPKRLVVGLVHAGWKGTLRRVAANAVQMMNQVYGSKPDQILAAIGPSIGPDHYEIGPQVSDLFERSFSSHVEELLFPSNGAQASQVKLDLWRANDLILRSSGVQEIESAAICTACNLQDWFSHRAEGGVTGRFGALIALNE